MQSRAGHLEHAELVGRAEPVLHGAKHAVRVVPIAFELQHTVDEVLEDAWAGDGSVLRHVPDKDRRDARLFRGAEQARGRLADLSD